MLRDYKWWTEAIWRRFEIIRMERRGGDVKFVCAKEIQLVIKSKEHRKVEIAPLGQHF